MFTNIWDTLIHVSSCPFLSAAESKTDYIPGLSKPHKIPAISRWIPALNSVDTVGTKKALSWIKFFKQLNQILLHKKHIYSSRVELVFAFFFIFKCNFYSNAIPLWRKLIFCNNPTVWLKNHGDVRESQVVTMKVVTMKDPNLDFNLLGTLLESLFFHIDQDI